MTRSDDSEARFRRIATAVAKYWVCKRATAHVVRGARMPGGQRLRRRFDHAAAVSRVAAELDLGRLGQRDLPGRAAGDRQRAADASTPCWPRSIWGAAATNGSIVSSRRSSLNGSRWPPTRARRGVWWSDWRWLCKDRLCCGIRRHSWQRPSAPRGSRRMAARAGHTAAGSRLRGRYRSGLVTVTSVRSRRAIWSRSRTFRSWTHPFRTWHPRRDPAGPPIACRVPGRGCVLTTLPSLSTRITVGMPMMP